MYYLPSEQVRQNQVDYKGLGEKSWVVHTGILDDVLKRHHPSLKESALDLGCGRGSVGHFLSGYYGKICGVDIVDYRHERYKGIVEFSSVDLNFDKLAYRDGTFDLVTALQVIEHLENPFLVMREVHRVLRSSGLFIMSVPNPYNVAFRVKYLLTGNMPPWTSMNAHLLFLTKDVFAKTYLANFELVETFYQKGAIPCWGRLALLFGKRVGKHKKILPATEAFSRRIGYVLRKK